MRNPIYISNPGTYGHIIQSLYPHTSDSRPRTNIRSIAAYNMADTGTTLASESDNIGRTLKPSRLIFERMFDCTYANNL